MKQTTAQRLTIVLILSVLFCYVTNSTAQPSVSDLENQFKNAPTAENVNALSKAYQERGNYFLKIPHYDRDTALYFLRAAAQLIENKQPANLHRLSEVYTDLMILSYETRYFNVSDSLTPKAEAVFSKIKSQDQDKWSMYKFYTYWSFDLLEQGEFKRALSIFLKAQNCLATDLKTQERAFVLRNKGWFYLRYNLIKDKETAYHFSLKSLELYHSLDSSDGNEEIFMNYRTLISHYRQLKQIDSIYFYLKKYEKLAPYLSNPNELAWIPSAYCFVLRFYPDSLLTPEIKAHILERTQSSQIILKKYNLEISPLSQSNQMLFALLESKNGAHEKASEFFRKASDIAALRNTRASNLEALQLKKLSYAEKGDFKTALEWAEKEKEGELEVERERSDRSTREYELQLNVSEREKELSQQRSQKGLFIGSTIIAFLLSGAFALIFYRERRNKTKLEAKNKIIEQQADILKQLDASKTRFFANVSHELRTPLTLMLAPLGTMLKSKTLDNRNRTLANLARQHSQNLLMLVNEILDLTKLESGKMISHEEPTEIYEFMRRLVAIFESYAAQRSINLVFDFDKTAPHAVLLDKPKFEKIFNNLLSNALKFTPNGGTITVKITHAPTTWQLSVSDTGRGIHPSDLPHVFNRFYQTNQSDTPIEGGTGIGLALVNELTQVMNGKISVQSELKKGSTFVLELPKREVFGVTTDNKDTEIESNDWSVDTSNLIIQNSPSAFNHPPLKTILVVEDNSSLRNYLQLILSDHYNVITAENGEAALKVVSGDWKEENKIQTGQTPQHSQLTPSIDLIISDIMMPVMNGFQLLEKLKADEKSRIIPVVMLTARAEIQDKLKALTFGVDDYLIKPFEEEELFARIKNLLHNAESRKQAVVRDELSAGSHDLSAVSGQQSENDLTNKSNSAPLATHYSQLDKDWLEELEKTVRSHLSDKNLSVEALPDLLFMSRAQMFRRIHLLTGLTPLQYIQALRFNHARQLLERRAMSSVKAVALAIGIQKTQYFSEQFKERYGKSPSEYLL